MKLWTALAGLAAMAVIAGAAEAQKAPPAQTAIKPPSQAPAQTPSQTPAQAPIPQIWIYAKMAGGGMGWEATSMDRDLVADTAVVTRFVYYAKPQTEAGVSYSVVVQDLQFKCAAKQFRLGPGLLLSKALKPLANANPEQAWADAGSNTPEDIMRAIACDGVPVAGAQRAASAEEAVTALMKAG